MENYHQQENEWVSRNISLEDIIEFSNSHRVEVLLGADFQYNCYVDYKEGDGFYGSGLTFLGAVTEAILRFKNKYNKKFGS